MRYNSDTDGQDLVSFCDDLVNTNSITYPIKEKTRAANKTLRRIWAVIFEHYGGWQYDDSNNTTNFPEAVTSLNATQSDYLLPTEALSVRGVDIKVNNLYTPLVPITEERLKENGQSEESFLPQNGTPLYYYLKANSVVLYPAANTTIANGLRVSFDRGSVAFTSTDTTKQPGFASEFHEAVAVGMALEYAKRNNVSAFTSLQADMDRYERDIGNFYSKRHQGMFPATIRLKDVTLEYT